MIISERRMICTICTATKTKKAPHRRKEHIYRIGELICSDINEHIRPRHIAGSRMDKEIARNELYFI